MAIMSVSYRQLLDAAIQHLERMKAQGVKFVSLSPESLAALSGTGLLLTRTPGIFPSNPPAASTSQPALTAPTATVAPSSPSRLGPPASVEFHVTAVPSPP